ncbi:hypothetical protein N7456_001053 [Penicillium angulare]|uniref:Uncharacterized protein n=1 Tax=Penicillium angulare TaxID=116970 RepID=A0A9W9KSP3_9EURO|nr:hypothetical protein N7456_001053 [Penicillium angulare]
MSLSTLVGMYPNHHATQPHDKVYALLGLANEEDAKNLWPDYDIEWHEVLIRLAQLTFPQSSVQAWSGNEFVVIKCKGNVLGYVCNATPSNGQQKITILYNSQAEKWGYRWKWESVWTVEEMAVSIRDGDMICMIQERSEPSVIRLCGDHFALIIPVARPVLSRTLEMDTYSEDEIYEVDDGTTAVYQGPSNDICLKWRVMGDEQISETSSETRLTELAPGYRQSKSESEAQLDHIARIMEGIFGIPEKEHLNNKAMENIIFQCDKNIPLTRIAWVTAANEGYIGPDIMEALFKHWGQDLPVDESVVIAAAENIGEAGFAILETFFRHRGQNVPVSPSVVQSAIWNKSKARLRIFEVLFKYLGRNVPITEDHVKILVKREYSNEVPMLKVLSRQYGRNLPVTEEVVQAAAQNKGEHGTEIMEILAEHQPGGQFWNPVK